MKIKGGFIRIFKMLIVLVFLVVAFWVYANVVVARMQKHTFDDTVNIPKNKVGLLLGTSKHLKGKGGHINLYYKYRIDAAVELYEAGKIEHVLISGDNSRRSYNEPATMKDDLVLRGIPKEKIHLDYAGFRTLDSVVRSKKIFGQDKITVISQQFHNERAIYLAQANDIEAVGFNAKDVSVNYGFKTQVREKLARPKMLLDLWFGKNPKFLGEKIEID